MIYLYLKTHNISGLKYLGKTSASDPHNYRGSGKYWKRHINVHGYDVTTEILFESENHNDIKQQGLYYSKLWNVSKNPSFANLRDETGDGGWDHLTPEQIQKRYRYVRIHGGTFKGKTHTVRSKLLIKTARHKQVMRPRTEDEKRNISERLKGHVVSEQTRLKIGAANKGKTGNKGIPLTPTHKQKLSIAQTIRFKIGHGTMLGKAHSEEAKQKIRLKRAIQHNVRRVGEYTPTEETRQKISIAHKGKTLSDKHKQQISNKLRGKPKPLITCPYCGTVGGISAMKRWHFDNCKDKENVL